MQIRGSRINYDLRLHINSGATLSCHPLKSKRSRESIVFHIGGTWEFSVHWIRCVCDAPFLSTATVCGGVRTFHINSLVAAHFGAVLIVRFTSWREKRDGDSDDIFVGLPSTNYTLQLAISVRTIPCELLIVVERGAATRVKWSRDSPSTNCDPVISLRMNVVALTSGQNRKRGNLWNNCELHLTWMRGWKK